MITFKEYLVEQSIKAAFDAALEKVTKMIGPKVEKIEDFDDSILDTAKEERKEFIKTGIGSWIVTAFKTRTGPVVQVASPKDTDFGVQYFMQAQS